MYSETGYFTHTLSILISLYVRHYSCTWNSDVQFSKINVDCLAPWVEANLCLKL